MNILKNIGLKSLGLILFLANMQTAFAVDTPALVAKCIVDGKAVEVETSPSCGPFIFLSGDLGGRLNVSGRVRPGYGMLFHDFAIQDGPTIIAKTSMMIPDHLGNSQDDWEGKASTLNIQANHDGHVISCEYRIGAAMTAMSR